MAKEQVTMLPVVHETGEQWLGNFYLEHAHKHEHHELVGDIAERDSCATFHNQHIFDALRQILRHNISFIPVVGEGFHFEGIVTRDILLECMPNLLHIDDVGSVLLVELEDRDYTLTEIFRLIEADKVRILGMTVQAPDDHFPRFRISLKLNVQDASRILASLKRHGYIVTNPSKDELLEQEIEHRADELLHYLEL